MVTNRWDAVWERARAGKHTVIVGSGMVPSTPNDLKVLRVSCQEPWTMGGPLDEVLRRIAQLLGDDLSAAEQASAPHMGGLRSRLLDHEPARSIEAVLVEACNRLASETGGRAVLCFEVVDAADVVTVATLTQILRRPGWLRLPVILALDGVPQGLVATLVEVLRSADSNAVIEAADSVPRTAELSAFDWTTLSPDVLRVLRAGAVLGTVFEVGLIARLLGEPSGAVLETLQRAADAGVPLADRGEGRFMLPSEAVQALRSTLLPSLLAFWHAQLGELLSGRGSQGAAALPEERAASTPGNAPTAGIAQQAAPRAAQEGLPGAATAGLQPAAYAELFEPASTPGEPDAWPLLRGGTAAPAPAAPTRPQTGSPRQEAYRSPVAPSPQADQARAAAHLREAGQTEAAVEQYLVAMQQAVARGDAQRSYTLGQQALGLLDGLPRSERRALLRTQLLLELGHVQWQGAVLGSPFTLQEALTSLEAARASLPATSSPDVAGRLAAITAGVCYDLGDMAALQRALNELTTASRRLLEVGEATLAARLLNEQAAVYVRLGDPVRAAHLLSQSHQLFERLLHTHPDDPVAMEELAATDHQLARLLLHTRIRPGREQEAYAVSLGHAQAAERAYQRLNQGRELARVWETMGRLELGQGRFEAARERLATALEMQKQLGDVVGLARSTAALAELCITTAQLEDAVALLTSSIALNFEKGSPIGLAFNRRTFEALHVAARQGHAPDAQGLWGALREVEGQLVQAESVLGRLVLPGEGDPRHGGGAAPGAAHC
jgi:tetratricopeptide (TPR) repeat protein